MGKILGESLVISKKGFKLLNKLECLPSYDFQLYIDVEDDLLLLNNYLKYAMHKINDEINKNQPYKNLLIHKEISNNNLTYFIAYGYIKIIDNKINKFVEELWKSIEEV